MKNTTNTIRIGNLGWAIAEASRKRKDVVWLKKQFDVLFTKLRKQKREK